VSAPSLAARRFCPSWKWDHLSQGARDHGKKVGMLERELGSRYACGIPALYIGQ
jgi:hypothetical protein